jgi:magnesium transporter
MSPTGAAPDFAEPIAGYARKDFPLLREKSTVGEALETIRRQGVGERVIYFYVVDEDGRLAGVLPTRRLLTGKPETGLDEILVRRVVAIPSSATVLDACEFFVLYKFLAFPVVDAKHRVIGVVDVSLFAEEMLEAGEREAEAPPREDIFEALGFRLAQVRDASAWRVFRYRFPWLLATVATGTACALLSGAFERTLANSLVIAFFLTMVLGLNESVSMQSMTLTIHTLRAMPLRASWFLTALRREAATAGLLGAACGFSVGAVVWIWRADLLSACVIGSTVFLSLITASLFGLSVPSLLHWLKLDPKIAAGPVTLALTDFCALVIYFTSAWLVLR